MSSSRLPLAVVAVAATLGFSFAAFSTLDFVAHLDRQVHDLHCSFVPGLVARGGDAQGCQVTLLSPYSSIFRTQVWGGIPISLPAMAVFALLLYRSVDAWGRPSEQARAAAAILLGVAAVPFVASLVMGVIAWTQLHAACKLCIGIYVASVTAFVAAAVHLRRLREAEPPSDTAVTRSMGFAAVGQALAFVGVPLLVYTLLAPDFTRFVAGCGTLRQPGDPHGVMIAIGRDGDPAAPEMVEVLDPLCPSCRGLEERLAASDFAERVRRRIVLFPLDARCNWMVQDSLHPGACAVSEALLCADETAGGDVEAVLAWAFATQDELIAASRTDPEVAEVRVKQQFPALARCIGSSRVRARLNKSLRWAVTNELPVSTPQIFVAGHRICPEDTDLGLDWTLHRVLARLGSGSLVPAAAVPASVEPPDAAEARPRPTRAPKKAVPRRPEPPAAVEVEGEAAAPERERGAAANDAPAIAELPSVEEDPPEETP